MGYRPISRWVWRVLLALCALTALAPRAEGQTTAQGPKEWLCDASYQDCRTPLIQLIRNETTGLDVAFWFMQDARYETEIIKRWKAGVPVRVLVDPKANPTYAGNDAVLADLAAAGIPMRQRASSAAGILHWKMMLFAGQNIVEFSGANFSPTAFVPQVPYIDYEDETIYFSDDPSVVQSFMTEYDTLWLDTVNYRTYANIAVPLARVYPIFPKDGALNFPQQEDYALRILKRYPKELERVDVIMYRITDERETNAMIALRQRGIPVRLLSDLFEYRDPVRQWVSYNLDKLWAAGVPVRVRAHLGLNHQKLVLFYANQPAAGAPAPLTVFGSSNWTTPSANQQQEHNYFSLKPWIFDFFRRQFERKWCSGTWAAGMPEDCADRLNPIGAIETQDFVPLPPDKPINSSPVNATANLATTGIQLKWNGGYYAHLYDVYFGVDPAPPLFLAGLALGPVDVNTPKTIQHVTLPALQPGTTYYWRIVASTMANLTAKGPTWSFTTKGTPPPPPPPPPGAATVSIWASDVPAANLAGVWQFIADPTAAGGSALWNADKGKAKISPPLASPVNDFEVPFDAMAGVPYHLWIRMRAQSNSVSNDSVTAQFSDAIDAFGSPTYRIGTASGAEVVLQDGPSGTLSGWGWADNGFGTFGPDIYFPTTGSHTLRIQQRTDGAVLDQIVLSPDVYVRAAPGSAKNDATILGSTLSGAPAPAASVLPDAWSGQDVGVVGINGRAGYDAAAGAFSVLGGGGDIWGTGDGLYYASRPLAGDGSIVARVTGVQHASVWSRSGIMIRETMAPGSAHAFMFLSAGKTLAFERRRTAAGSTFATPGGTTIAAPYYLRLDRAGDTFTGYASKDGVAWTYVGSDTVAMAAGVYVGLAVTSATLTATSLGTFDHVAVTAGTPPAPVAPPPFAILPDGWSDADIGNVGFTGGAAFDVPSTTFSVKAAGNDIWGTADAFHYVYRAVTGDGLIVARVRSLANTSASAKAGVMIRETLDAGAANAFVTVTPTKGTMFQRRTTAGAASVSTAGTLAKPPCWLKLERIGALFNAYQSPDGVAWTLVGSDSIGMGATVYVGLAVSSHTVMTTTAATFDSVGGR